MKLKHQKKTYRLFEQDLINLQEKENFQLLFVI